MMGLYLVLAGPEIRLNPFILSANKLTHHCGVDVPEMERVLLAVIPGDDRIYCASKPLVCGLWRLDLIAVHQAGEIFNGFRLVADLRQQFGHTCYLWA